LPVEEPANSAPTAAKATAAAPAAAEKPPAPSPAAKAEDSAPAAPDTAGTQTLELMDPELLLSSSDVPTVAAPQDAADAPQVLEVDPDAPLTLEDPAAVEKLLAAPSAPAPSRNPPLVSATPAPSSDDSMLTLIPDSLASALAKASAAASPAPSPPPTAKTASAAAAAATETPAFVPLAKRASLSAAAKKLAAASTSPAAPHSKPSVAAKAVPPSASVTALKPQAASGAAAAGAPGAKPSATTAPRPSAIPVAQPAAAAPPPDASPAPGATPTADAPSLASWANARAAAAASAKSSNAAPARAAAPASKAPQAAPSEKPRPAAPAAPAPAAASALVTPSRGMDRDFIARNQVVERYLSGKLPIKAATDFERYCKEHPELLDELGLPERVNAGLRLLEASGKPEPWQEASRPLWQQPMVTLGLAGLAGVLALSLALVAASSAGKTHKILDLQTQVAERTLDPAASTRVIRLLPNRSGATNSPAITIGGGREAQLADLRLDESRSPYRDFRVTIDRIDQGRVMVIDNLSKDSNGHLRIALNSSALGPGNYLFTIEGLTTRLEPQPDSWVTIGVAQR